MGKGSGKLAGWVTQLRGGVILVELKNLRLGRAVYFSKQLSHKLPVPTTTVLPGHKTLHYSNLKKLNVVVRTY